MEIVVEKNEGLRIDKYLSFEIEELSRNKIQKLLENGHILVNQKSVNNNYKVSLGDKIEILDTKSVEIPDLLPSDIPVDIVYEDDDLLVINKKSGMVTHPAPGNYENTLVNALLYKYNLSNDSILFLSILMYVLHLRLNCEIGSSSFSKILL